MNVPNRKRAYVPEQKLKAYLLSLSHPVGKSKARFFRGLGFDEATVDQLREELKRIVKQAEVEETERTIHGTKYVVVGLLHTPNGEEVSLRTVWMIEDVGGRTRRDLSRHIRRSMSASTIQNDGGD